MLSELEGAVMLEVHMRGRRTAFQVRKSFINSPTADWSGSAGAVYPAIKRLEAADLLCRNQVGDARGTHELSLTSQGIAALHEWATDPNLASRMRADPFRTRSDYLKSLPAKERIKVFESIRTELMNVAAVIDDLISLDHELKTEANTLASRLISSRLDWIEGVMGSDRL